MKTANEFINSSDKYLLYIDILGFRQLVETGQDAKIREILKQVAKIHAHNDNYYNVIMFSDTILIYNNFTCTSMEMVRSAVSWLCEFSADLFKRLISIDVHFRAVLKKGPFNHEIISGKEFFFGKALIDCYDVEKIIPATGLFIESKIAGANSFYNMTRFNDELAFVYLTGAFENLCQFGPEPLTISETLFETVIPDPSRLKIEVAYLQSIYTLMHQHPSERVREKHLNTWSLYLRKYGETLQTLADQMFNVNSLAPWYQW